MKTKFDDYHDHRTVLDLFDDSAVVRNLAVNAVATSPKFSTAKVRGKVQGNVKVFVQSEEFPSEVVKIATMNMADLYPWAESGAKSLLGHFQTLARLADDLALNYEETIEFEERSVEFWSSVLELQSYYGCSKDHDVAITSLTTLAGGGDNSIINHEKAIVLQRITRQLANKLSITMEDIVAILDDLEDGGFDVAVGMNFDPGIC